MATSKIRWHRPPDPLIVSQGQVHLWRADLKQFIDDHHRLRQILSSDEQQRADRFYFERDRYGFIVGRGLLRMILSRYLAIAPNQLQFTYGPQGKPELQGHPPVSPTVTFNLSHSQGLALYAVTCDRPIGVDLEHIRSIEAVELAQRFFAPQEYEAIAAVAPDQQERAFFEFWTCKEAYLKAIGKGLGGLSQVEIALTSDHQATVVREVEPSCYGSAWFLKQLIPAPNYTAALAVVGSVEKLSYFDYGKDIPFQDFLE